MTDRAANRVCLVRSPSGAHECMEDAGHEGPHKSFWGNEWPRASSNRAATERCVNTIHSNYVTDHRCQLPKGHEGDCLFGRVIPKRVDGTLYPNTEASVSTQETYQHADATRNSVADYPEDARWRQTVETEIMCLQEAVADLQRRMAT